MSEYTREEILRMIEENGGPEGLDLSNTDLSGIDLGNHRIGKELEEYRKLHSGKNPIWFSETTYGVNLSKVNLGRANLSNARLEGVNLREALLDYANLQGAKLRDANLYMADLTSANLQETNLHGADFQWAELSYVNLQGARAYYPGRPRLTERQPGFVDLPIDGRWLANFQNANLHNANLNVLFSEVNFQNANLQGTTIARLTWSDLKNTNLVESDLRKAMLYGSDFQGATLIGANLEEANLEAVNLQGTNLWMANFQGARLIRAQLEGVDLGLAKNLARAYFGGVFLARTRMRAEQLGDGIGEEMDKEYYEAKEAYILLKNNFSQIGRYNDASWAYIKEPRWRK
jgi:uncharacterized protein YjbI with pentapeptide repeats